MAQLQLMLLSILLALYSQQSHTATIQCNAPNEEKEDCGYYGINDGECLARGCCWSPSSIENVPWCFHGLPSEQCTVPREDKEDCGYYGINEGECLVNGCCWRPSPNSNDPWCFHAIPDAPTEEGGTENELRLVDGPNNHTGRLEIYHEGRWGTVCDDQFEDSAATVVCRSLGYGYGYERPIAQDGEGSGPILLDDVACFGNESSLLECSHKGWGEHNCGHDEDVGVRCSSNTSRTETVRLAGGPSWREGRVELFHDGEWGTVCDDQFTSIEAGVVCRSLGYEDGVYNGNRQYGQGSGPILLDDLACTGDEDTLEQCQHDGWGNNNCGHSEDVGVQCSGPLD